MFISLESMVCDMSSKHVMGEIAQWDIRGLDSQYGSSVTRESTFSDKESETNSLCSRTFSDT